MRMTTRPSTLGKFDLGAALGDVVKGGTDYYSALNAINQAKYGSKLIKAQAQAAVAQAKAGGVNAVEVARTGLPSPTLLVVGAGLLAALMILKK